MPSWFTSTWGVRNVDAKGLETVPKRPLAFSRFSSCSIHSWVNLLKLAALAVCETITRLTWDVSHIVSRPSELELKNVRISRHLSLAWGNYSLEISERFFFLIPFRYHGSEWKRKTFWRWTISRSLLTTGFPLAGFQKRLLLFLKFPRSNQTTKAFTNVKFQRIRKRVGEFIWPYEVTTARSFQNGNKVNNLLIVMCNMGRVWGLICEGIEWEEWWAFWRGPKKSIYNVKGMGFQCWRAAAVAFFFSQLTSLT